MMLSTRLVPVVLMVFVLGGCTINFPSGQTDVEDTEEKATEEKAKEIAGESTKKIQAIPVGTVKPEINFSSETPNCEVAAQRIADNLQVGMTQADVRRLVGKPGVVLPGRWLWSKRLNFQARPVVLFGFGFDSLVSSFTAEVSGC